MNKVIITSDSTCDLSPALVEQYGIKIIPLYVNLGDESFKDGLEIQPEGIYDYVAEKKQLPKTSAASMPDYMEFFSALTNEGYDVVHFNISSSMSVTHQNAKMAAEEVEGNVYVIDSANLSTGIGLLVLDAADLREEGKSAEEIYQEILRRVPLVRASFVVDQLDYLRMGGRCSSVAALGANLLKLHPLISVENGAMGAGKKYRGGIDAVMVQYAKEILAANAGKINPKRVFVTHTQTAPETVAAVTEVVKGTGIFEEILDTVAGCVITCHCGPGTLGVLFEVTE
ncbi:MAG: DegV family protein [Clostridia bacterium]|nr:DegV family protein [Clostridia bacterium]